MIKTVKSGINLGNGLRKTLSKENLKNLWHWQRNNKQQQQQPPPIEPPPNVAVALNSA
jgi:hypothetical protein